MYCIVAFALVFTSCEGEDGMDRTEGLQGIEVMQML